MRTVRKTRAQFSAYAQGMRKRYFLAVAAVTLALGGCAHKTTAGDYAQSTAVPSASAAVTANTEIFSGVVTRLTPMTGGVQVTFMLPDGEYKTAAFESADGISVGDSVSVDGQEIAVVDTGEQALGDITMPGLLADIEAAEPDFADDHTLGGVLLAADFAGMESADVTNALAILPTEDDATLLCYIETAKPQDATTGFESYADAIVATYTDDPYAPAPCTDACALAQSASVTSGDDWALMIIAPDDQKSALLDAVSAWQESEVRHD